MLQNAGYTVTTREVPGQTHTYTPEDVIQAWAFLKSYSR
jgi:hypothetical protein